MNYNNFLIQKAIHQQSQRMHRISLSKTKIIDQCPQCNSELEMCNTLPYCVKCKNTQNIIDDTIKEVNLNFKLHYHQNKSKQATFSKIQSHAKDIFCKINMKPNQSQINQIVQKIKYLHKSRGQNKKGYKQQTAAVIYSEFQNQIRMSLNQFCEAIQIPRKKFNKMYLQYKNFVKQLKYGSIPSIKKQEQVDEQNDSKQLKLQQQNQPREELSIQVNKIYQEQKSDYFSLKNQQFKECQNDLINSFKRSGSSPNLQSIEFKPLEEKQLLKKTIQSLYDSIFSTFYLTKHKQEIISSIIRKGLIISQEYTLSKPLNKMKPYFRGPAIIYSIIKINGYKITIKDYLKVVQDKLGVKVTERMIYLFTSLSKRIFPKFQQEDQGSATQLLGSVQASSHNSESIE